MTKNPLGKTAENYIDPRKRRRNVQDALNGAKDILAERISETAEYSTYIRRTPPLRGEPRGGGKRTEGQESVYEMYYQSCRALKKCAGHRVLA